MGSPTNIVYHKHKYLRKQKYLRRKRTIVLRPFQVDFASSINAYIQKKSGGLVYFILLSVHVNDEQG